MAIPLDDLQAMLTRPRRASGYYHAGAAGRVGGWEARGGQTDPAVWTRIRFIRKVCAGLRDIAYFPKVGPGNRDDDATFIANARQDLPRLVREWREINSILIERGELVAAPVGWEGYLQQTLQVCDRATAGPWCFAFAKQIDPDVFLKYGLLEIVALAGGGDVCHVHPAGAEEGLRDAQFIAYARHAVPYLATEVLKLRGQLNAERTASDLLDDVAE